jgi:hypothetical protein
MQLDLKLPKPTARHLDDQTYIYIYGTVWYGRVGYGRVGYGM